MLGERPWPLIPDVQTEELSRMTSSNSSAVSSNREGKGRGEEGRGEERRGGMTWREGEKGLISPHQLCPCFLIAHNMSSP